MAKLTILEYPDPRLRTKAVPVERVGAELGQVIDDMFETMYAAPGIGLAATQVDFHQRLVVMDVSEDKSKPLVLINPEIIERSGALEIEEGCLSVPGVFDTPTTRSEKVRVRALGRDGKPFELEADGLLAVCVQHEMDHLDGKVFVEYLSLLKQTRIRSKLKKKKARDAA
jgi:peptide deformylase